VCADADGAADGGAAGVGVSSEMSRVPQFPQNAAPGTIGAAQVGHPRRVPQRMQNLASAWFSAEQFEQITIA
jgi:hypothetical protein